MLAVLARSNDAIEHFPVGLLHKMKSLYDNGQFSGGLLVDGGGSKFEATLYYLAEQELFSAQ